MTKESDPGRAKLESIAMQQRAGDLREETPDEAAARFGDAVRARMASPGSKGLAPSKRVVMPQRVQLASSQWNTWDVIPEFGTTVEDLLDPAYWAHVARKFNPWDQVVVRAEDGSYLAAFVVVERGHLYARVKLLPGYPLSLQVSEPDVDMSLPNQYSIKWNGPHEKYVVLRDGGKLRTGFGNKGEATTWVRNHLRGMVA